MSPGTPNGPVCVQLAKAKPGAFPHVDSDVGAKEPYFQGTIADFEAANPKLAHQLKNKVRKCKCGKANAVTLSNCNSCGDDITAVEISYTPNVFVGFIYGVAKGPFPYTISLRHESEDTMVFDDLLSLSPLHLNAIPTDQHIPDVRYVLADPTFGSQIVDRLEQRLRGATKTFLANKDFREKYLKDSEQYTDEELMTQVITGFNYPPSQYQLHLQWIMPPLLPFQHYNYLKGLHFCRGRFLPLEFVREVLKLNVPYPNFEPDTPIEDMMVFYKERGVDYEQKHATLYAEYGRRQERLSAWNADDFEAIIVDNTDVVSTENAIVGGDPKAVQGQDVLALQNYGRPYTQEGKPQGRYFSHAKSPGQLSTRGRK